MENTQDKITADIQAVNRITAVSMMLEVICRTTGMGFAAVARVTEDRWVACAVKDEINFGLKPGGELQIETTICNEIRISREAVVIDHVEKDGLYCKHHTPAMYGFQSYISVPIILKDGTFFGTLCAIDPKPADLNNEKVRGMFKLFADLLAFHLNALDAMTMTEKVLQEERKNNELREQFIAVLGHDLRNPVSAILSSAQLLQATQSEGPTLRLANVIENSTKRITGLIDNMLDFARGRLAGGIVLKKMENCDVEKMIRQVITELQVAWPGRIIDAEIRLDEHVNCDAIRMAQLFSNILGNAVKFGRPEDPVIVKAISDAKELRLSVTNTGSKIPETAMSLLFKPFARVALQPNQQGLGLGLYIAHQIATAHGGTIEVDSNDNHTTFTFRMPVGMLE